MLQRGEERPRDFGPAQSTVRAVDVHFVVGEVHNLRHYGYFGWMGLDYMRCNLVVEEDSWWYVVLSLDFGDTERAMSSERSVYW